MIENQHPSPKEISTNLDINSLPGEFWLDIVNHEGIYQISNYGRVKSSKRIIYNCTQNGAAIFSPQRIEEIKDLYAQIKNYRKVAKIFDVETKSIRKIILGKNTSGYGNITTPEKILCQHIGVTGYWRISLRCNNKSRQYFVHRLLASTFIPNPENKPQINHINGIKLDNRIENLEWCTNRENSLHAWKTGLNNSNHCKGELHRDAKLTRLDVITIRERFDLNQSRIIDLAKDYNLSQASIAKVVYRKSWKHIA